MAILPVTVQFGAKIVDINQRGPDSSNNFSYEYTMQITPGGTIISGDMPVSVVTNNADDYPIGQLLTVTLTRV